MNTTREYALPCSLRPQGDEWEPVANSDPRHMGQITWRNRATGEEILCPSIWYNQPAEWRAKAMRFYADRAEQNAARCEADQYDRWATDHAARHRKDAARLRALADEMERTGIVTA